MKSTVWPGMCLLLDNTIPLRRSLWCMRRRKEQLQGKTPRHHLTEVAFKKETWHILVFSLYKHTKNSTICQKNYLLSSVSCASAPLQIPNFLSKSQGRIKLSWSSREMRLRLPLSAFVLAAAAQPGSFLFRPCRFYVPMAGHGRAKQSRSWRTFDEWIKRKLEQKWALQGK